MGMFLFGNRNVLVYLGGILLSSDLEKKIREIKGLIIHGQFQDALKLIEEGLKTKEINKKEELNILVLKSRVKWYLGDFQDTLQLTDKVIKDSKKLDYNLILLDALIERCYALFWTAELEEASQSLDNGLELLSTIQNLPEKEFAKRRAFILHLKAMIIGQLGDLENSLELASEALVSAKESENRPVTIFSLNLIGGIHDFAYKIEESEKYYNEALKLAEELGNKYFIAYCCFLIGSLQGARFDYEDSIVTYKKGFDLIDEIESTTLKAYYNDFGRIYIRLHQLDEALECFQEALKYSIIGKHIFYGNIGDVYHQKYELEKAREFYLKSIEISDKIGDKRIIPGVLYGLITLSLELKNHKEAQVYLDRLEQISKETGFEHANRLHRFSHIIVLKASGNIGDLYKAVELLDDFLAEKDLRFGWRLDLLYTMLEIRIKELQISSDEKTIEKVKKQAIRLEVEAEEKQFKWFLANIYRLQSKIALIELKAEKAIELLEKSQLIANEIDVELLRKGVMKDKEKIEKQLGMWNDLRDRKAPVGEIVKLVSLEDSLKSIKQETILEERDEKTGKIIEYRKLFSLKI
ncbi:MAG: tetratricopeptide repeat protein [Asgard group archaeon]|nr:tetratricopeptide repeat protein [Asgard group archaeon]